MNKFLKLGAVVSVMGATFANAALTAPTISTSDFELVAGVVLAASGVFWAIRKAIGLIY